MFYLLCIDFLDSHYMYKARMIKKNNNEQLFLCDSIAGVLNVVLRFLLSLWHIGNANKLKKWKILNNYFVSSSTILVYSNWQHLRFKSPAKFLCKQHMLVLDDTFIIASIGLATVILHPPIFTAMFKTFQNETKIIIMDLHVIEDVM